MNLPVSILFAVIASSADLSVDFFYFEGLSKPKDVDVNFGLHGECRDKAISTNAAEGILIKEVRADGQAIEPRKITGYRHGVYLNVIEHPGPSFFFHMALSRLESDEPYDPRQPPRLAGTSFVVTGLPGRLEIRYQVRCADGTVSREYVTRGKRYPRPQYIKGSGG